MSNYTFAIEPRKGARLYPTAAEQLNSGGLVAYSLRSNGTERRWELCPVGSERREVAEWIIDEIEVEGRSVSSVARSLHVSNATVRRIIEALDLTEEIEAGEWDELWQALLGFESEPVGDGFEGAEAVAEALAQS